MWLRNTMIACRQLKYEYIVVSVHHAKIATTQHHQLNDPSKISLIPPGLMIYSFFLLLQYILTFWSFI